MSWQMVASIYFIIGTWGVAWLIPGVVRGVEEKARKEWPFLLVVAFGLAVLWLPVLAYEGWRVFKRFSDHGE